MRSYEVHAGRYHIFGNSKAITVPIGVREALRLQPDDLLLMSVWGSLLIMRRVDKRDVVDVDAIPAAAIPGSTLSQVKNGQ